MAITYSWDFSNLQVQYTSNSLANVVTAIDWQYGGESGSGEYHHCVSNHATLGSVAPADFIAYENLTEDLVKGWVTASLFDEHGDDYITTMQTKISGSIAESLHPVEGGKAIPW